MPAFAFWNTYRLGGGSGANKKIVIEGVLAQIFEEHPATEIVTLCEVTGDVNLGDAPVGKSLYKASRKMGQLAYSAFDSDLNNLDLEAATIPDFMDVFGNHPHKKGGGVFSKQSKRPVAYLGSVGVKHVYIYHANASNKSAFLVSWVAESLRQEHGANFILAGDLNCEPPEFNTQMDLCNDPTGIFQYHHHFHTSYGGKTHNAKKGLSKIYDWAVSGAAGVTVTRVNFSAIIDEMGFDDDPKSDHLPIVISW